MITYKSRSNNMFISIFLQIAKTIKNIDNFIINILFPITCLYCKKGNFWICQDCLSKIKILDEHICPICEKKSTPDGRTCFECKKTSSLSVMVVSASYKDKFLPKAIHLFKYRFIQDLQDSLGQLMTKALMQNNIPIADIIIPIPLHPRRLRWRGFNQSELLADFISKNLLPNTTIKINSKIIYRKKYTLPQMHLKNFQARRKNIANAFGILKNEELENKTILLVDDVATTGSTILECSNLLKKAGAGQVFAIVLARQEFNNKK